MSWRRLTLRQWAGWIGLTIILLLATAVAVWRGDILKAGLDPQVPFQTYTPPPAPDYRAPAAWAMRETRAPGAGPAAIFFVHSTTYDGGRHWNGPIGDRDADAWLSRVVLPNYAGPFARAGAISAPRYRQGSLYTRLTRARRGPLHMATGRRRSTSGSPTIRPDRSYWPGSSRAATSSNGWCANGWRPTRRCAGGWWRPI
jgi:hypothetical protein